MQLPKIFKSSKLLLGLLVLIAVIFGGCYMVTDISYSEGERTGIITKFSHRGVFVKIWEGEMSLGGIRSTGTSSSNDLSSTWAFSVTDPAVIQKIQHAQRAGGINTLHYKQTLNPASWRSTTGYYVIDVVPQISQSK